MANSRTLAELKNWELENPSLLFGPLAQYLESDKRHVMSPCITYICMWWKSNTTQMSFKWSQYL